VNLYAYAGGDPVNYADPLGLCPFVVWLISFERCKQYDQPSPAEQKAIGEVGYRKARIAARLYDEAIGAANRLYPAGKGKANGKNDAFMHAFGSCRMTQQTDAETAETLGNAHEDKVGNPDKPKTMDLHNNAVGRQLGRDESVDCARAVQNAINTGKLIAINADNNLETSGQESQP
jgi:hypothetical protein